MSRRAAAQERTSPTCPDRREVPRLDARSPVTDAVDAAVLLEELSGPQPAFDLRFGETRGEQLRTVHDTVRAARESSILSLGSHNDP